ncbi:MAG TPA: hypothetical protein DEP46_03650 [Blastocatellia bacterium]|nr:hypothetical protein [Blastocatellia bacterium]
MKRALFLSLLVLGMLATGAQAQTSVAGDWDVVYSTPGGPRPFKLVLAVDGEKLSGTAKRPNGDVPVTGTIKGNDITFSYTIVYGGNELTLTFSGKVDGDAMAGNVSFSGRVEEPWSAKRAAK